MWKRIARKPLILAVAVVLGVVGVLGLYWFQPWKLITDTVVAERLPAVAPAAAPEPSGAALVPTTSVAAPAARVLAAGDFVTHEHETTGTAQLVELPDGRRQLLLRDLDTSNGPDLRVWLTDQPVIEGTAGWRVFDDGRWVELGRLKGNRGDQAYAIPPTVNLAQYGSVTIWCRRFAVSFGAAALQRV